MFDDIISNAANLHSNSGLMKEEFGFLDGKFQECVKDTEESPLDFMRN